MTAFQSIPGPWSAELAGAAVDLLRDRSLLVAATTDIVHAGLAAGGHPVATAALDIIRAKDEQHGPVARDRALGSAVELFRTMPDVL